MNSYRQWQISKSDCEIAAIVVKTDLGLFSLFLATTVVILLMM